MEINTQLNRSRSFSNQSPANTNFNLQAPQQTQAIASISTPATNTNTSSHSNLQFIQGGDRFNDYSTPHIHLPPEPLGNDRDQNFLTNFSSSVNQDDEVGSLSQAEDRKIQMELDDFVKSLLQDEQGESTGDGNETQSQSSNQRSSFFPVLDQFLVEGKR